MDSIPNVFRFEKKFQMVFPERKEWAGEKVFTDGSKVDGRLVQGLRGIGHWSFNTAGWLGKVVQAETLAVSRRCYILLEARLSGKWIMVISDSKAALKALPSCKLSTGSILECRKALEILWIDNGVSLIVLTARNCRLGMPLKKRKDGKMFYYRLVNIRLLLITTLWNREKFSKPINIAIWVVSSLT